MGQAKGVPHKIPLLLFARSCVDNLPSAPSNGSLGRKRVSDPELASLGRFQGAIERFSNFRDQALNHNLGRNVRVVKVLAHLAGMMQNGCAIQGRVECTAAVRQNFSSSKAEAQEAAHFLPGQLKIGGLNLWHFASDYSTRSRLEFLFAEVEHLPAPFNQADSAAERKGEEGGLCAAFAAACEALLAESRRLPRSLAGGALRHPRSPAARTFDWRSAGLMHPDAPAARLFDWSAFGMPHPDAPAARSLLPATLARERLLPLVRDAFAVWHRGAMAGLREAAKAKLEKPGLPPLVGNPWEGYTPESIEARSAPDPTLWNREEAIRILGYYLEDQRERTPEWALGVCRSFLYEL